jgi:glycosyltransferase involved in cell wall biosynthesis
MKPGRQRTICIITQSHLCNNPRVLKEATTLADQGYSIYILNGIYSNELLKQDLLHIQDRNIKILSVADLTRKTFGSAIDRALYKLGRLLIKNFGIETAFALGYGLVRYFKAAVELKADLYICHQELATYIGDKLIKQGFRVAFDFEDWYSEDLLENARTERPVNLLREMESRALSSGAGVVTTSAVLAGKLSETYNCRLPGVIYNVFPSDQALLGKPKQYQQPLKVFWFSQTVGPGRGIENFIHILRSIHQSLELHLLGNVQASYQEKLTALMPVQHHLFFHAPVESNLLPAKIAEFDIGLALELKTPMSRDYTITNKFFQYLQSGLPLIATETAGQNEAFEKFKPGIMLPQTPSNDEIAELDRWLGDPGAIRECRGRAVKAAQFYNWENESRKLIQFANQVFENAG